MLTNGDIAKLVQVFATKEDLNNLVTKEDLKELATKSELRELRNDVMTKMDQVYGEVLKMRDEQVAHHQEHDDINDRLDKIELTPAIAQQL